MTRKKLVVLSGAGISAESGLKTFRDADGLWEGHSIYDVATPEAWHRNPDLVQEFYNQRRKQLREVNPNAAHIGLAELEAQYDVQIITQNVDDLHERAGSTQVLHLHGELNMARSTGPGKEERVLEHWELKTGDLCENGFQLRPHIVWFGEEVPALYNAAMLCQQADILLVIGTSLQVYPAAGLVHEAPFDIPRFYIDPKADERGGQSNLQVIAKRATEGIKDLAAILLG